MTAKTKHSLWMWGAGIFLLALYFGPSIMNPIRNALLMRQQQQVVAPVPPPPKKESPAGAPGTSSDPQAVAGFNTLAGIWRGELRLAGRGTCSMRLDIRFNPAMPGQYAGFSTLTCVPNPLEMALPQNNTPAAEVNAMTKDLNPTSAILAGTIVNNAIEYKVQKNIGVEQTVKGCNMTAMTVSPFGVELALDWKEQDSQTCKGGQVVVKRSPT